MTPMLARPATAGQATFEPEEPEEPEEDDEDEEDEDELLAFSPDFLSPVPDLSLDDEEDEDDESELAALSDFLASEPFVEAAAGSELFWLVRLSFR
jgi:hypothetical protein